MMCFWMPDNPYRAATPMVKTPTPTGTVLAFARLATEGGPGGPARVGYNCGFVNSLPHAFG